MAETAKPRTRTGAPKAAELPEQPAGWFCKNCGETNPETQPDCVRCGFVKEFDPEVAPAVDFSSISATLAEQAENKRRQLSFILELVKNSLLLIVVVVFIFVGFKLINNWPFTGAYEADANSLLDAVLAVQSHVELGVNKGQYDELLVPMMVQNTKFKIKYGESPERQKETYQQLNKAAEFYEFARVAWDNQLTGNDPQSVAYAGASSKAASEEVQRRWDEAKRCAILAAQKLQ